MKETKLFSLFLTAVATGTLLCAADAVSAAPAAAPAPAATEPAKPVDPWSVLPDKLAEYDGQVLTKAEFKEQFLAQFPNKQLPPMVTPEMLKEHAPDLVREYVQQKLLLKAMEKAGYKPSAERVKALMQEELKTLPKEQIAMIESQLQAQGKTLPSYIDEMAAQQAVQEQAALEAFLPEVVLKDVKITEAEVKKYYDEHTAEFVEEADPADAFRASHILVLVKEDATEAEKKAAKEKIDGILKTVKADPARFEEMAQTMSDCPSGKRSGGDLGVFTKGQMVPEFEQAVASLKDGEISGVVTTPYGYHIIRRNPLQKEKQLSYDEVKERLTQYLLVQKRKETLQNYMADLAKKANVKILL